jgi:hypothetical protein
MKSLLFGSVAMLAIVFAVSNARPVVANDDEMGGMDGGGDGGGLDLGSIINDAIGSFGSGGDSYDPGYEDSYPSYPGNMGGYAPAYNGSGYAPASNGGGYAPQHAPLPANRLPPVHSSGSPTSTTAPPANPLPRHRATNKPIPTDVAHIDTGKPPANPLPRMTTSTPWVCRLGSHCDLPEAQMGDLPSGSELQATADRPYETDDASGSAAIVSQPTIDADIVDEQRRQAPLVRTLLGTIPNQQAVDVLVDQLPNPPYDEPTKRDIRRAVNEGNLNALRRADRGGNSPAFTRLVQIATAVNAVNRVRDKAQNGTLTRTDIQNASNALRPFTNGNPQVSNAVQQALGGLLSTSSTIARLRDDLRRIQQIANSPSIVRRLPPFSSSMGGLAPVARQPAIASVPAARPAPTVPVPAAVPAAAAAPAAMQTAAKPVSRTVAAIVLVNADEQFSIRYTVNGEEHEMKPRYEHSLSGGDRWLVEFDRGNDLGIARYKVISGTYKFVVTERGWDLVKKASQALDTSTKQPAIEDEANLQRQ